MIDSLVVGVAGMNLFATALVLARAWVWRTRVYRPMLLNIGLSLAPLGVLLVGTGLALVLRIAEPTGSAAIAVAVVTAVAWLLLLPNSSYLITELNLSHRREGDQVPLWYDIVLVITLAMSGVLNTVLSVLLVQLSYAVLRYGDTATALGRGDTRALVLLVLVLVPVGMYLGRYVRLNSWDVRSPARVSRKVRDHLAAPGRVRELLAFTALHAVFLGLMYLVLAGPLVTGLALLEDAR